MPPSSIDVRLATARASSLQIVRGIVDAAAGSAHVVEPVIPVDSRGWESVLADSRVAVTARELLARLDRVCTLNVNDTTTIGGDLRRELIVAAEIFERLLQRVEAAFWFVPPGQAARDRDALMRIPAVGTHLMEAWLDALTSLSRSTATEDARESAAELAALADRLANRPQSAHDERDAVALMFGAPAARFTDRRGVIDSARIRAFYADRPEQLEAISRRLLTSLIGDVDVPPPDGALYAASFAFSERPLICHQVARETLAEIRCRFAADPETTGDALARRFAGVKHSASTHFDGLAPTTVRLEQAQSDSEGARLALELYRLCAEGPLRQTGWSYLELRGHPARKTPKLAEVRDLLLADGSPLALLIADGIHTEWRNPSAHEEHHWHAIEERIVLGDVERVTRGALEAAAGYALSVMHGFETGVACARIRIADLGQRLESEDAVHEPPLVDMRVRNAFGRLGVWVWDTSWRSRQLEIVLEADLDSDLHRILAGVLGASLEAPAQMGWRVVERDGDHLLHISPQAIAAASTLLPQGARHGPIDVNVLLPLAAAFKTAAGEPDGDVAVDVTRLALKHPLGIAEEEATAIVRQETAAVERLVNALDVAARALPATWDLVGTDAGQRPVIGHLEEARAAARAWSNGERAQLISLEYHLNRLYDAYHALPDRPLRAPLAATRNVSDVAVD